MRRVVVRAVESLVVCSVLMTACSSAPMRQRPMTGAAGSGGDTETEPLGGTGGNPSAPVDNTRRDAAPPVTTDAGSGPVGLDAGSSHDATVAGEAGPVTTGPCPGGAYVCDDFEKYATTAELTAPGAWRAMT